MLKITLWTYILWEIWCRDWPWWNMNETYEIWETVWISETSLWYNPNIFYIFKYLPQSLYVEAPIINSCFYTFLLYKSTRKLFLAKTICVWKRNGNSLIGDFENNDKNEKWPKMLKIGISEKFSLLMLFALPKTVFGPIFMNK